MLDERSQNLAVCLPFERCKSRQIKQNVIEISNTEESAFSSITARVRSLWNDHDWKLRGAALLA
jgi:hypothetical protein